MGCVAQWGEGPVSPRGEVCACVIRLEAQRVRPRVCAGGRGGKVLDMSEPWCTSSEHIQAGVRYKVSAGVIGTQGSLVRRGQV